MVSILDVAKRAGVSPSTARRAINEPHLLAPETLERVLKAVADLEYEPNQAAGALRRGRNLAIGWMVGDITAPFFSTLTRVISREVRFRGYTLLVAENEYDADIELLNLKMFSGHRVSGIIIRSSFGKHNYSYLERMQEQGAVIVEIDYIHESSPFHHVMLENVAAATEGVHYLRGLGHRRIAGLGLQKAAGGFDERTQGFVSAMKNLGLDLPDAYNPTLHQRPKQVDDKDAYDLTLKLMQLATPPTALFTMTSTIAMGAVEALRDLHLQIPEDVSLLTFDNDPLTRFVSPPLCVLEQPTELMGQAAAKLVLDEVERPSHSVVRQRFPARLIKRQSCAPPYSLRVKVGVVK